MEKNTFENKEKHCLTPQQTKVLKLLAEGLRNKEIAYRMGLKISTVKQHISGIMLRLNVRTRTGVVIKAQKLGLTEKE